MCLAFYVEAGIQTEAEAHCSEALGEHSLVPDSHAWLAVHYLKPCLLFAELLVLHSEH